MNRAVKVVWTPQVLVCDLTPRGLGEAREIATPKPPTLEATFNFAEQIIADGAYLRRAVEAETRGVRYDLARFIKGLPVDLPDVPELAAERRVWERDQAEFIQRFADVIEAGARA